LRPQEAAIADIFDWSATAASNTTLDGINVNTGMSPGNVDNAFRSLMALVRNTFVAGWEGLFAGTTSGIPVSNGAGTITAKAAPTGDIVGTSDAQTLTNKTISGLATDLAVADGGTGASTAAAAFANIAVSASSLAATGYIKFANNLTLQWGTCARGAVSLPIAFPTAAVGVFITPRTGPSDGDEADENPYVSALSTTAFTISADGDNAPNSFYYLAVGY
jgi:hypothetical protein